MTSPASGGGRNPLPGNPGPDRSSTTPNADAVAAAPAALFWCDENGHVLSANKRWQELLGLSPTESAEDGWQRALHPDDRERVFDAWARQGTGAERVIEHRIVRPDGSVRWLRVRAARLDGGSRGLCIGSAEDITDERAAETARVRALDRLQFIAELDRAIIEARLPAEVADMTLAHLARLVPYARSAVMMFDTERRIVQVLAGRPTGQPYLVGSATFPISELAEAERALQGHSRIVRDLSIEAVSALDKKLAAEGNRSLIRVPLISGPSVIGCVALCARGAGAFTAEHVDIVLDVAGRVAAVITNARLIEQLRDSREELARLTHRLVDLQETERTALARELHDEFGQLLTALKFGVSLARQAPPGGGAPSLDDTEALIDDLLARVRRLTLNLRPPVLDDHGLLGALLWLFERYTLQTCVSVRFRHEGLDARPSAEVETAAYRIVQEALTNAARHAGVPTVTVEAARRDERLHILVEDRGRGFANESNRASGGVLGMRERAALIGGVLLIETGPDQGTRVMCTLPCGVSRPPPAEET